ncbi:MAG: HDOD domain-containing protein [Rubrivivax sp.]|nr:HDOD domain-containing protein [Rubrivivax sp.]
MPTPPLPFITRAPRDVAGWVSQFELSRLPVLSHTADVLEELRATEDAVDAHSLAEDIVSDPLMTLKLLAHVAHLRRGREGSEVETVTEALVMLGIPPFFNAFGPQQSAQALLADEPDALAGFERVLARSHRAARFAIGFAVHRMDHDAPVIHEAALLHDFAELLLWLHAPALALDIQHRQAADSTLRSVVAQKAVLNIELAELQHALMKAWRLPSLLVHITNDHAMNANAQVRNVMLAIRVARHSAQGWDNAALPDDVKELTSLLQLSSDATLRLLQEIDSE